MGHHNLLPGEPPKIKDITLRLAAVNGRSVTVDVLVANRTVGQANLHRYAVDKTTGEEVERFVLVPAGPGIRYVAVMPHVAELKVWSKGGKGWVLALANRPGYRQASKNRPEPEALPAPAGPSLADDIAATVRQAVKDALAEFFG